MSRRKTGRTNKAGFTSITEEILSGVDLLFSSTLAHGFESGCHATDLRASPRGGEKDRVSLSNIYETQNVVIFTAACSSR